MFFFSFITLQGSITITVFDDQSRSQYAQSLRTQYQILIIKSNLITNGTNILFFIDPGVLLKFTDRDIWWQITNRQIKEKKIIPQKYQSTTNLFEILTVELRVTAGLCCSNIYTLCVGGTDRSDGTYTSNQKQQQRASRRLNTRPKQKIPTQNSTRMASHRWIGARY